EEIAPRRDRVVEIDALAREQQRAVEARLDKRLRAQPLRDRRSRLTLRGASRRQCDRSRADRRNEEQDGERKQGAQTPVRASERGAALLQELTLEPVQALALAAGDEAEQDPARDLLVVLAQRPEGRFRVAADRAANTSRPLVRGMGQGASVAVAPEVEQRRREKRQPARLAGDIIDERVDE